MKTFVRIFLCGFALLFTMSSCHDASRKDKMNGLLAQSEKKNAGFVSLASDSIMDDVLDYYMAHGNTDEQVRANYIMGSVYRDRNDAPRALSYYKQAIRVAESDKDYVDNKKLSRIYGQIGYLYHHQSSPSLEREAVRRAYHYAMLAKDTVAALIFYSGIADSYHLENKLDSALMFAEKGYEMFLSIGRKDLAAGTTSTMADIYVRRKDFKRAKQMLDDYELYSGMVKVGKATKGHEMYYAQKGDYYLGINKIDSALYFYRKVSSSRNLLDNVVAGYKGMMLSYAALGKLDSVSKYAVLYEKYSDSLNISRASLEINKMRAVYDYTESQKQAYENAAEAEKYKQTLYIVILIVIAIAIILYNLYRYRMRKRTLELAKANAKYSDTLHRYNSLLAELSSIKKDKNTYIEEKEREVENLQVQLAALVDDKYQLDVMTSEHELLSCDIVRHFHAYASKGESPAGSEWKALEELATHSMPSLCKVIYAPEHNLSNTDIRVCILVRLQFITIEMASLLGLTKQRISNIKSHLNIVLFNASGAKTLGKNIQNL